MLLVWAVLHLGLFICFEIGVDYLIVLRLFYFNFIGVVDFSWLMLLVLLLCWFGCLFVLFGIWVLFMLLSLLFLCCYCVVGVGFAGWGAVLSCGLLLFWLLVCLFVGLNYLYFFLWVLELVYCIWMVDLCGWLLFYLGFLIDVLLGLLIFTCCLVYVRV